MSLRAVLFDAGGTILKEVPRREEIYAEVARSRGRNLSAQTMGRVMRAAHRDLPQRSRGAFRYSDPWFRAFIHRIYCQNLGLAPPAVADITEELFARFEDPATFHVFEGARELLVELRERGLRLAVVSNWSERLPRLLERLELAPLFDELVVSATVGAEKPDSAIFATALERLGPVPASAALHVGDHPAKDGAARDVGIDFVLVDHAAPPAAAAVPETADPPRVTSFAELRALLADRLPT